jgi:hypothetical protein
MGGNRGKTLCILVSFTTKWPLRDGRQNRSGRGDGSPLLKEWLANPHYSIIVGVFTIVLYCMACNLVSDMKMEVKYLTRMFSSLQTVSFLGAEHYE